jgi:hypothetical protein
VCTNIKIGGILDIQSTVFNTASTGTENAGIKPRKVASLAFAGCSFWRARGFSCSLEVLLRAED